MIGCYATEDEYDVDAPVRLLWNEQSTRFFATARAFWHCPGVANPFQRCVRQWFHAPLLEVQDTDSIFLFLPQVAVSYSTVHGVDPVDAGAQWNANTCPARGYT